MKKCLLYIEFVILAGCSLHNTLVETKNTCHKANCIEWIDKKQTIQYYEQSLGDVRLDDNKENN